MAYGKRRVSRRTTRKTYRRKRSFTGKRTAARANRAIRMVKALSRRVAGEVCKFESTPNMYTNMNVTVNDQGSSATVTYGTPLSTIQSGVPWIMPLNWIYTAVTNSAYKDPVTTGSYTVNLANQLGVVTGISIDGLGPATNIANDVFENLSVKNPIWYNTIYDSEDGNYPTVNAFEEDAKGTEYQYRLKYMYLNALFNAGQDGLVNNDGALRIVLVKDKQPTGGAATWFDDDLTDTSRGVFNAQRIDAQLNPRTLGRFKICYDKTLRFSTINGYKPFKYFKKLSSIVRNNKEIADAYIPSSEASQWSNPDNRIQTSQSACPVQKNAYYLMIFSDGLNFTHTNGATTEPGQFHLFNRIAYYNN